MLKTIFEGKREVSNNASEGDVTSPSADPIPFVAMLASSTTAGVVSALPPRGLITGEGRLSIRKCPRDAKGVESFASVLSMGASNPFAIGDRWVAYQWVEDQALGVLVECRALELRFQSKVSALKQLHQEEIRRIQVARVTANLSQWLERSKAMLIHCREVISHLGR